MAEQELRIAGMYCSHCAQRVQVAMEAAGGRDVEVDWQQGRATVGSGELDLTKLQRELAGTRYTLLAPTPEPHRDGAEPALADPDWGKRDYNLVVVGSGSAAFAAAIKAKDLGLSVLLIEQGTVGGTCVNIGCVPSKTLIAAALEVPRRPTLGEAVERKNGLVAKLRQAKYLDLLDLYGIELRHGRAQLTDPHTVSVDGAKVTADVILIATGAKPAAPPIEGLAEVGYLTSTTALDLPEPPRRLAVIGAGAVGLELGQALGKFGSQVAFIEMARTAPTEEPELAARLRELLEREGHTVLERAAVQRVAKQGKETVVFGEAGGEPFSFAVDAVLVATGRRPNSAGLGLERLGVTTDRSGAIVVDPYQQTTVPSIYAAGDVANQPQFVYVAAAGGTVAVENAFAGAKRSLDLDTLPRVIFTSPQLASAGLTQQEAEERGRSVTTSLLEFEAVPRALLEGWTDGLVKLVADRETGKLVGGSVLAPNGGDLVQALVYALRAGFTVSELADSWSPYLTFSEALKLAAQSFTKDPATLSCCAA
jgi:mercuric reductase